MPLFNDNHITICYETFGNANNPCLIFISGINGQLINWPIEMIQGLADQGWYVITFDNRDVGFSSYYDHIHSPSIAEAIMAKHQNIVFLPPYSLEDMAKDVITLMNGLEIKKAHIVGISMGGIITQLLAINYPERLLSLTCIATTSGDPHLPSAKPEVLKFFFAPRKPAEDVESYVNAMLDIYKIYYHPDHRNEKIVRDMYAKSYLRAYHPEGFKRQLLAMLFAKPRGDQLKSVQLPSLIIHGDDDPVFPVEHANYLAQCLPNSRLEIIEKLGHGLPECFYERIVETITRAAQAQYNSA
ncbi:MAG: hypothetical protein A3F11_02000 [Gammaproteobacteria bacterium RIFCSPHIGHO2_12_FULL_37_14]|nr:MAG: hypothetical protein A3F11_02000 [Gammaproteobacteria bacterium RIFCSPHIGHO2_12_FULL_37_14]